MSDLDQFRMEARAWLEENCPAEMREPVRGEDDVCWGGRNWTFKNEAQKLWLDRCVAKGYTVPDIGRITRAVSRPGVSIDTFLDIAPVISNNREVGVEVKRGPLDASATYFWSSSKKGQLLIARPDRIFDVQRQRVEIEGLELNLRVAMPIDGLKIGVGYGDNLNTAREALIAA